jgi:hypothetical protein
VLLFSQNPVYFIIVNFSVQIMRQREREREREERRREGKRRTQPNMAVQECS